MTDRRIADYFNRNYLRWQLAYGRASVASFAEYCFMSKGYMSGLMNGKKSNISLALAQQIAVKLNDYEILDILDYARPDGIFIPSSLPSDTQERLRDALSEISVTIKNKSLDPESEEAAKLTSEILDKYGFATTTSSSRKSG